MISCQGESKLDEARFIERYETIQFNSLSLFYCFCEMEIKIAEFKFFGFGDKLWLILIGF